MLFTISAALAVTFGFVALIAEWIYPNYVGEKKRIRIELRIATREIKEFRQIHTEDVLKYNLYWQREFAKLINSRAGSAKELFRMKVEFIVVMVVFAVIVIAIWTFVLYKIML